MLSRKIIYSVLIIVSICFYVLFIEPLSFYTLIFILSLPIALLFILIIGKFSIKYKLYADTETAIKSQNINFTLKITNKSIFPFPSSVVLIKYQNKFSDNTDYFKISFPIHPRTSQELTFKLSSEYCGILKAEVKNIKLYDYIKLFSFKIRECYSTEVCVVPLVSPCSVPEQFKIAPNENGNIFSKEKSGDDPSEIFDLKDYIPGDKINRIHWNLSSRSNQLITKHYSLAVDSPVAVISDFSPNTSLKSASSALELIYGICFSLIENKINHHLYIVGTTETLYISDYESLNDAYINILKFYFENDPDPDIVNSIEASKLFLVTNKPYTEYKIPEIYTDTELKCFFTGNNENISKPIESDNISVSFIDCESFENMPDDILF